MALKNVNFIGISGNLGQDPKIQFKDNQDGTQDIIVDISVAQWLGKDQNGDAITRWWDVRLRNRLNPARQSFAEQIAETVKQGDTVMVIGELNGWHSTKDGVDKRDNIAYVRLQIRANTVVKIEKGETGSTGAVGRELPPV